MGALLTAGAFVIALFVKGLGADGNFVRGTKAFANYRSAHAAPLASLNTDVPLGDPMMLSLALEPAPCVDLILSSMRSLCVTGWSCHLSFFVGEGEGAGERQTNGPVAKRRGLYTNDCFVRFFGRGPLTVPCGPF